MNQNTTYDGRTAFENAQVGDVIRVPQYEGALKVVSDGREVGRLGIEFVEDGRGSALKSLVQNENSGNVYLTAGTADKGQVEEVEFVAPVEREDEDDEDDDEDEETTLDDLEQRDEIEVHYTTSHGNEATLSGHVQSLGQSSFTDQTSRAVLYDPDDGRTYRLHGTRKVTVSSLRSGSPVQVGHSGTISVEDDDADLVTDGGQDLPTVEFRERRPDSPNELRGHGPEVQVGEVWASCNVCGYYGLVPRSTIPVEGVRCEECLSDSTDDPQEPEQEPELVTDGGVPVENPQDEADDAELIQVRGEHDGVATLSVYYRVGPTTFRARLRPVRPLPEEDHIRDREALVLSDLCSLDVPDLDGFEFIGPDAPTEEWFDTTHVPPVVRRAVDRPVQVPDLGNVEGEPDGR